ncbi:TPA: zonular occludens toxin [Vibrio vulnificus]|nr:zonular occludens toxin [Vibrio vulnificus]
MAVYFRHGSNGSYKSAYATWFELVPALRAGRLVVTNIEGLKPLEEIENTLGEKFPPTAKLIRIFTRSEEGVLLWQNWFNWMPIGALIIIDECQDLYSPDVGFKREKAIARPLSDFLPLLPENFSGLFHSRWIPCDPENMDDGDTDDTNRTQYDEHGRLLYPFNFYGAFMRHRKYQWDIIMLTPDWTSIPTWLRGCAQEAYSHRSTDTFFRKRRPRIFNHSPKSTKTDPTTKKDEQYVTSKKIPIDVFALYKSTGTGDFNESKSDISIFKSPRFILTMLIAVLAIGNTVRNFVNASSDSDLDSNQATVSQPAAIEAATDTVLSSSQPSSASAQARSANSRGLDNRNDHLQGVEPPVSDDVNPFFETFTMFNGADAVYLTAISNKYSKRLGLRSDFTFRIDKGQDSFYIRSYVLEAYGYVFTQLDECLIQIQSKTTTRLLTCPPYRDAGIAQAVTGRDEQVKSLTNKVDIFSM